MNRVSSGGCPYTASWLVHVDLFHRLNYGLHWQKMEAANWDVITTAHNNFQLRNESLYFVFHMSRFEHFNRKKYGYSHSETVTRVMSEAAMKGECLSLPSDYHASTLAIIPFYGGRPPNVTADLKVKSLGQGNSLVKADIKAMQTVATVCSLLRHFGSVVIGVVREEDFTLLSGMVKDMGPDISKRVHLKMINGLNKPANLPFGLIMWAKKHVHQINCLYRMKYNISYTPKRLGRRYKEKSCDDVDIKLLNSPRGRFANPKPVTHVYYTESDQLLKFSDTNIRNAILDALNITTHIIGRRIEKRVDSDAVDYMSGLFATRAVCGDSSNTYVLNW
eukprot:CAMPEP_0185031440 /NCGR_PEP_ID=MMETSP1103-20130426/18913_1 /TAXON_ID=36769 /ORGANISM="Paraphysomonas bandaiensis, Strain Caron Lab Isolate" /LENGTH=333 /DNA_ID=CAMNT_0027566971 /DNA_START=147 /DNA_END=1145 /DNA_ORIENTATION=-